MPDPVIDALAYDARRQARAHLRTELGDWCESYGWPRNTPGQLRAHAFTLSMRRAVGAMREFSRVMAKALGTSQADYTLVPPPRAVSPLDAGEPVWDRQ